MADFADRLAELEDRGSAVLVTGADATGGHVDLCGQLFGEGSDQPRRRVVVVTNGTATLDARLPTGDATVPDTTVISASATRGAATVVGTERATDVVDLEDASLADVGVAIVEAFERVEHRHGPLAPTELRLGVDSLAPLLDAHGEERVFAFLVVLTGYVRASDALGHVHLPLDRDDYVARLVAPLFDAVVELRTRRGQPQQRWYLDDGAVTSQWLPL